MSTFYVQSPHIKDDVATVVGAEHHHLRNVMRLGSGNAIEIIDGEGSYYTATIVRVDAKSTIARIEKCLTYKRGTPTITLFQSLPKHDKMELILQKTTELGVTQIVPMSTERSFLKPSVNKLERWRRIVLSATKQCGRAWLPEITDIQTLQCCLDIVSNFSISLICWEKEKLQHIKAALMTHPNIDSIALFIGPEGGFTENEVTMAIHEGCVPVKIGSRILRTETAAIAGIAMIAYQYQL